LPARTQDLLPQKDYDLYLDKGLSDFDNQNFRRCPTGCGWGVLLMESANSVPQPQQPNRWQNVSSAVICWQSNYRTHAQKPWLNRENLLGSDCNCGGQVEAYVCFALFLHHLLPDHHVLRDDSSCIKRLDCWNTKNESYIVHQSVEIGGISAVLPSLGQSRGFIMNVHQHTRCTLK
jgi:hypothetical protein